MVRLLLKIEDIEEVMSGDSSDNKIFVLKLLLERLTKWDDTSAEILLRGLNDQNHEVRIATLNLFCGGPDGLPEEVITKILESVSDSDPHVRSTLMESLPDFSNHIKRSNIEKILPLMKDNNADIRSAVIQVCDFVPEHIDSELCLELLEMYRQSDSVIQQDIYELLDSKGHRALLELITQEK